MRPFRLSGIRNVARTLAIAVVTTARAAFTISRLASRPTRTGSTSLVMTVPRLYGPRLRLLAVERESAYGS